MAKKNSRISFRPLQGLQPHRGRAAGPAGPAGRLTGRQRQQAVPEQAVENRGMRIYVTSREYR